MPTRHGLGLVVVMACAMATPARSSTGATQNMSTAIQVSDRYSLPSALNALARQGFRVDAVATPEAPLLPQKVVVVLSRPAGAAQPATDYRVVSDTRARKVEEDVNALAAKGYVLKGVTLATGSVIGTGFAFVAVLERVSPPPEPLRQYRLAHTHGTPGDWKAFEQAGRDGFDVIDVIAQLDPNRSAAGDVTFVCEKRADGAPVTFTVKASGDAARVERDVNDLAAAGHTLRALWPGTYLLSALLSRASTTNATTRRYEIDADPITVPDVSSLSGRFIAWVRFNGEQVAAFDRAGSGRYAMVTDPVPDADSFRSAPVERARDRVDVLVRRGYRPFWARYGKDDKGALTLSVILEQRSQ